MKVPAADTSRATSPSPGGRLPPTRLLHGPRVGLAQALPGAYDGCRGGVVLGVNDAWARGVRSKDTRAVVTDKQRRVLVVEDSVLTQKILSKSLDKLGIEVVAVRDCAEARELLASIQVDLVILDIFLPGESGLEFMKYLKGLPTPVPFVAMSGAQDPQVKATALAQGAIEYLPKPIWDDKLVAALKMALRSAETQRTSGRPRLLLMEDDALVRKVLRRTFEMEGVDISEAQNVEDALAYVRTRGVDVVVADFIVQGGDALALIRGIKNQGVDVPVIVLTAHADEKNEREALSLGAAAYIVKSSDLQGLKDAVRKVLPVRQS